jgi:hypothetical protein
MYQKTPEPGLHRRSRGRKRTRPDTVLREYQSNQQAAPGLRSSPIKSRAVLSRARVSATRLASSSGGDVPGVRFRCQRDTQSLHDSQRRFEGRLGKLVGSTANLSALLRPMPDTEDFNARN